MPYQFICRSYEHGIEGCCGATTRYSLEAHYEAFRAKPDTEYPDLAKEKMYLELKGFLAFEKKYPKEAAAVLKKAQEHITLCLRELSKQPAAVLVAWFVKPSIAADDAFAEEYEGCYRADTLRVAMLRWPGALNMGAYVNPNTGNIIQGIQITGPERNTDHED